MKTIITTMSWVALTALAFDGGQARAQAPSDVQERSASPLDPPTEAGPDTRVAPETRSLPIDTMPAPSPLATPPMPVAPIAANGTPKAFDPEGPAPESSTTGRYAYTPGALKVGAGVLLGGGFEDFTNSNLRGMTSGGGFWNARLVAGTHQVIGLEAAYTGAARNIDALGLSSNARLVSNGAEGAVRGNIPIRVGGSLLEPFVLVGLGWEHYTVTNTPSNTSDLNDRDDVMTLPLGTGFEYSYGRFLADARVTYRRTYFNDLMRTTGGNLDNLSVGTQLGVTF